MAGFGKNDLPLSSKEGVIKAEARASLTQERESPADEGTRRTPRTRRTYTSCTLGTTFLQFSSSFSGWMLKHTHTHTLEVRFLLFPQSACESE